MTLIYNATFDKNTRKLSFEDKAGNEIYSFVVPERGPSVDDITKPLTFKATQDGSTVKLTQSGSPTGDFQTSTDGGNTWADYTIDDVITLNTGDEVSFRAKSDRTSRQNAQVYFYFMMEGKIEAWHNVMSLYRTNNFATYNTATQYSFNQLFKGCTSLTKAPALPATTLENNCYVGMFDGCTSLTKAPALPATTLADYCYYNMFYGCSSLNEVSCQMPSTISEGDISASYTYDWLNGVSPTGTFYTNYDANWPSGASGIPTGWTRVNEGAPSVDDITKPLTFKATQDGSTVKLSSYNTVNGAFQTSLDGGNTWSDYTLDTAITLNTGDEVSFRAKSDRTSKEYSGVYFKMTGEIEAWHNVMSMLRTSDFATYESMVKHAFLNLFQGCTSLTKAPVLPATTLAEDCYSNMFDGCTSLTEAPVLPATTLDRFCYWEMFKGCTSLIKAPELSATTLKDRCYKGMFYGCSSLNEVRCNMPSSYSSSTISSYAMDWLYGVSSTGTFYTNADANWSSGASGIPTGWTRVNEGAPSVDNIRKPLTFRATQDGSTVKLKNNGSPTGDFQTSRDGGNTWTDYTIGTAITLNTGLEVSFRAKADRTTDQPQTAYFYFEMTGKIEAWHNVMSLYRTNDFSTYESVVNYAFSRLFRDCTSLTKAPVLPATTLAPSCYGSMFSGCTSLTKAPVLPATTLAPSCYGSMFSGCTSLTKAPELPATTLADSCYGSMFHGCTSLTEAPELPATALSRVTGCYQGMFSGCTSLTKAPELPATILSGNYYDGAFQASHCYDSMFMGCASLTKAPALPATTLAKYCYSSMFRDCTSLAEAPELPATTLTDRCYNQMFYDCTSLTKAPALSATTLAQYCYDSMFSGCTSLTKAPALPATTLAEECYDNMFDGCTSLTEAPALPATTLASRCYQGMFRGCSSLNKVRCKIPSTISEGDISSYTYDWLYGVSSTGTFYTNADANWPSGASGIPQNWSRSNI